MVFRNEKSFEARVTESKCMLNRYPDRIPIIVEKRKPSLPTIDKRKYMAPVHLSMSQFTYVIRRRLKLEKAEALFMFVNDNTLIQQNLGINETYHKWADADGFLYLTYDMENTFGGQSHSST